MEQQELAIKTLRDLMETCRESEAGFLRAASRSHKTGLKQFLGAEALQQAVFIAELQLELKKLGVAAKPPVPSAPKLPAWKEIRDTRLLPSGDDTLLVLCERGERAVLSQYLRALQSDLPVGALELVKRQHCQLEEAYERLDQIREQLRRDEGGSERDRQRRAWISSARRKYL
jgi:uncharacterized protein (TIGR02284 family)